MTQRPVISAISHLARLARAGFVFAREGVFALVDPAPLPLPARTAIKLARLIERPTSTSAQGRLAAALTKLGPTYVKLGQFLATRPDVVGVALARDLESLQDKMAPFPQAEAEAVVAAALGKPLQEAFASFGPPVAAASIAQVHRAEVVTRRRPQGRRREGAAARRRAALPRRSRALHFAARHAESLSAEARRLRLIETVETLAPLRRDRNGPAARSRGAVRDGGEHQGRSGFPRADDRLGPHRQGRADARMDRRHAAARPRHARGQGLRPQAARRTR